MDSKGDIIDQGNVAAELHLRAALSQRAPEGPAPTGYCHNCEARLAPRQRWCDTNCRTDWERAKRAQAMAPREPDPVA
jgi:hypothetical protein